MTAKVISLCEYRRSREEEKRLKRGNVLGLPKFNIPMPFPVFPLENTIITLDEEEESE